MVSQEIQKYWTYVSTITNQVMWSFQLGKPEVEIGDIANCSTRSIEYRNCLLHDPASFQGHPVKGLGTKLGKHEKQTRNTGKQR
jgi:hypothetical protein